ncbi:MAG: hypothetical protein IJ551_06225 [Prevotella sp.]|nr:hypothetical protein [Prevotella sp.]
MAKNSKWHDDYWLLLMQIYLRNPVGVKPVYSRAMVELGLELHINPQLLAAKMQEISTLDTPRIERIWQTYGNSPRKLARAARLLREMKGFGKANEFYDGVELNETWEKDWQPLTDNGQITPVVLMLVLDLYFRLTPATMVKETPEVQELARLTHVGTDDIVELLDAFLHCDPYLNRRDVTFSAYLQPCQAIWQRYGNGAPEDLAALAEQLKEYYRNEK